MTYPQQPTGEFGFERAAKRKLSEQLVNIASNLSPGPGYELTLEGAAPIAPLYHELEAIFGAELDSEAGATLELRFSQQDQRLVLHQLKWPIKGVSGDAYLTRTEIGYLPTVTIRGKEFIPRDATSNIVTRERSDPLLAGFGIETPALSDLENYQAWRNHLLGAGKSWRVLERREIAQAITMHSDETIVIENEEVYNPHTYEINQIRSVQHRTSYGFENTPLKQVFTRVVELAREGGEEVFRLYERHHATTKDIIDGTIEISDERMFAVPLTADSFQSHHSLLEQTQSEIYGMKALKN